MPAVQAVAKQIGASPKRLKPILDSVRGQNVDQAVDTLSLLSAPWAKVVSKVVQSAAAIAENNLMLNRDSLRIIRISADQAKPLKRFRPRARGRIGRITQRSSHITVVVDTQEEENYFYGSQDAPVWF